MERQVNKSISVLLQGKARSYKRERRHVDVRFRDRLGNACNAFSRPNQ